MSDEELKAELERLRNENAALKKGASSGIRLKVSEKGAVSVYGMGRFPVGELDDNRLPAGHRVGGSIIGMPAFAVRPIQW